ncbi:MAG: glycosyltransferase [Oligoflexia bacterium]|nr:glycosyltransferase [Oligoflexia bacterium]
MCNNPLVSICLPCFNGGKFIKQTIESILAQTYSYFELIIIDDCSLDDSILLIKNYSDQRIRFFQNNSNVGLTANWIKCIRLAQGEYIKIVCQDDLLLPSIIEKQLNIFLNDQDDNFQLGMVSSHRFIINKENKIVLKSNTRLSGLVEGKKILIQSIRCGTNIIGEPHSVLIKRKCLDVDKISNLKRPFMIDFMIYSIVLNKYNLFTLPQALSAFRISGNSWSCRYWYYQSLEFILFTINVYKKNIIHLNLIDVLLGSVRALMLQFIRKVFYIFVNNVFLKNGYLLLNF